jgi:hypothetical protein
LAVNKAAPQYEIIRDADLGTVIFAKRTISIIQS